MALIIPVILCGGSGTRLWPLSRSGFPKQFLDLSGGNGNQSLFQGAVGRVNALGKSKIQGLELGSTLIVTNEDHRFLVLDQLREMDSINAILLLEPVARNTAPALSLAAFYANELSEVEDPILVVTPADQAIQNQEAFTVALKNCIRVVEQGCDVIAVLGIKPITPETGYGYIERSGEKDQNNSYVVNRFVEKPDPKTAQAYLNDGTYLWNAGMFVMRASTWLGALKEFRSDIFEAINYAWQARVKDSQFMRPGKSEFENVPSQSIDYAVIEKCPGSQFSIKMVELDANWNDLGSWDAVWQVGNQNTDGNVVSGDVVLANSKNCLVHSTSRLVSAVGVEDLIIIETADALLVADRKNAQDVKDIVRLLDVEVREEKSLHRKVARPWGWYDSIDEGKRFKVKRIQVKPGASLSLQTHLHRAEHWIVVKGIAEVTNGEQVITLQENQSTYIPKGQIHRLSNPGTYPLEIIEVQSGSYLGEDDIIRLEDTYGRS